MALTSIPAIIDGERIRLLENAPVDGPYRVLVTFIEPVGSDDGPDARVDEFLQSFGAWQDDRPVESTVADIYAARVSRSDPPQV